MKTKKKIFNYLVASILLVVMFSACDVTTLSTAKEQLEYEDYVRESFLDYVDSYVKDDSTLYNPDSLTNRDLLAKNSIDSVDYSADRGIMYFENYTGTGERINSTKTVAYRYVEYSLQIDTSGAPYAYANGSNYGYANPETISMADQTYESSGVGYSSGSSVYSGIIQALYKMRMGGHSTVIIPSPLGATTSYTTLLYEIEVTYVSP